MSLSYQLYHPSGESVPTTYDGQQKQFLSGWPESIVGTSHQQESTNIIYDKLFLLTPIKFDPHPSPLDPGLGPPLSNTNDASFLNLEESAFEDSLSGPSSLSISTHLPNLSPALAEPAPAMDTITMRGIMPSMFTSRMPPCQLIHMCSLAIEGSKFSSLSAKSNVLSSTTLFNISWQPQPQAGGGFAYIFRGVWNGKPVALKVRSSLIITAMSIITEIGCT